MKTLYLIFILFFLNLFYCRAQEKTTSSIAELRKDLKRSANDTLKVRLLHEIGTFYYDESPELAFPYAIDSSLFYVNASRKLAEQLKYKIGIAKTDILESKILTRKKRGGEAKQLLKKTLDIYSEMNSKAGMASVYMAMDKAEFDSDDSALSTTNAQKALDLYKEAGNKKGQADALYELGYITMSEGKMDEGRQQLLDALELYKSVGYKGVQRLNSLIAINYNQVGKTKEAMVYVIEAIRIIDERNDKSPEAAEIYNYLAIIYDRMGDGIKSLEYLQKADKIAANYNNAALVTMLETNIVNMLMKFKRNKEALVYLKKLEAKQSTLSKTAREMLISRCILAYIELKNLKKAKKYVESAMEISSKLPPYSSEQNLLYPGIIKYHFATEQYDISRKYVLVYKTLSEIGKNDLRLADVHRMLFKLDSVQLRFKDALKEFGMAKAYNDSINNTTKDKAFQELEIKYDSDKKDKALLLKEKNNKLLQKQTELQKNKLFQANLTKNIGFIVILLLIIILSLVYKSYYTKQKNNSLLQSKNKQIDEKNTVLQKLADEREWLLREIHHRVKNNLQIVMSLLNTQSHYLTDKTAMKAINSSQHRIHSMSLIHKKLYQSDSLVAIHIPTYIGELIEYFKISFDTGQRIRFITQIEDINLDIAQAVPVGLILNETITNAIKHAFPNKSKGIISIIMKRKDLKHCELIISDNGIGLSSELSDANETLGMRLIKGLSDEIDGILEINSLNGYCVTVTFPFDENKLENYEKKHIISE
ncbi:MAG TPA: histidine kinase dimerization/phosphoacceptor domain -containing protein [Pedobacter sp.]|uniref:tetratricopeptide repeat-containing sensor histidine kinase n=1 Tax=Pedobacter sp. TaxID=1411316 RepID=UPI002CD7C9F3|nr:histidine kinase dimerization/phosphoacceptor domain -containing protein [Pedobacter sp.]HMI04059.1 histidine kinase dimerization/phosphoacceptor domain -containing protein [Pedobacter sp.]